MLPFLLVLAATATTTPTLPVKAATPAPAAQSLVDQVAARMTPQGRTAFTNFMRQTLVPQVRGEAQAEATYRQQLATLVAAPTLDVDAVQRLVDARKRAEASASASIRGGAFTMIKGLPAADRKLALTAIFAEARPVRAKAAAAK